MSHVAIRRGYYTPVKVVVIKLTGNKRMETTNKIRKSVGLSTLRKRLMRKIKINKENNLRKNIFNNIAKLNSGQNKFVMER